MTLNVFKLDSDITSKGKQLIIITTATHHPANMSNTTLIQCHDYYNSDQHPCLQETQTNDWYPC